MLIMLISRNLKTEDVILSIIKELTMIQKKNRMLFMVIRLIRDLNHSLLFKKLLFLMRKRRSINKRMLRIKQRKEKKQLKILRKMFKQSQMNKS